MRGRNGRVPEGGGRERGVCWLLGSIRAVGHWCCFVNAIGSRTEQTIHPLLARRWDRGAGTELTGRQGRGTVGSLRPGNRLGRCTFSEEPAAGKREHVKDGKWLAGGHGEGEEPAAVTGVIRLPFARTLAWLRARGLFHPGRSVGERSLCIPSLPRPRPAGRGVEGKGEARTSRSNPRECNAAAYARDSLDVVALVRSHLNTWRRRSEQERGE